MRKTITTFLHNWSPWHLRKRIAELRHDFDVLTTIMDDLMSEAHQHVVKENETLKEKNKRSLVLYHSAVKERKALKEENETLKEKIHRWQNHRLFMRDNMKRVERMLDGIQILYLSDPGDRTEYPGPQSENTGDRS